MKSHFSPDVGDKWEETTDANLTHLLRTALASDNRKRKDASTRANMKMPSSTQKLKKHLTIVIERLSKGATLAPSTERNSPTHK